LLIDDLETKGLLLACAAGDYMPNLNSTHCSRHQCPYWRRSEQDFGGVVEA
jgi:hypothetical protein